MTTNTASHGPHPSNRDLAGMFAWRQDHADELDYDETIALASALAREDVGPNAPLTLRDDDPYERHAELWAVVRRIAENYRLVPADEV